MLIDGACHCGNISFALEWLPAPTEIPARACGCSFCVKHGGVWTSNPNGSLQIKVKDPSLVSRYIFGTRTAEFHVCSSCGVVPVVTSEIAGRVDGGSPFQTPQKAQLRSGAAGGGQTGRGRVLRGRRSQQHLHGPEAVRRRGVAHRLFHSSAARNS